jgi:LysR family transcriptional regulator, transcriptional activator of nhaA
MEWLNYHHLFYFWTVVRTGSITKACEELRLAPPTVSAQLKSFEDHLGEKLLKRSGRNLVPTEIGLAVYRQAEEIFSIGREILDTVKRRPTSRPLRLVVGLDDVVPKEIAHRLIEPAFRLEVAIRLVCHEANLERLVAELALHEVDVVLSDSPVTPSLNLRVYNHYLGDSGVVWMGPPDLAKRYSRGFPKSLNGAPVLLPTDDTAIRRKLDQWFAGLGIEPNLVAEFEDYALLRVFGHAGSGVFPVPSTLENHFRKHDNVKRIGVAKNVVGHFYAISAERKIGHPGVVAICEAARREVFA